MLYDTIELQKSAYLVSYLLGNYYNYGKGEFLCISNIYLGRIGSEY